MSTFHESPQEKEKDQRPGHVLLHHLPIGHRFFELLELLLPDVRKKLIVKNLSSALYQLKGYESNGKGIFMCIKFK